MRIKITKEQKEKLFSLLEGDGSSEIVSGDKYKNIFGEKGTDFKDGYEKGYADGWLDAKSGGDYNDIYSWNKYSKKK
jgi:hypothetical protein